MKKHYPKPYKRIAQHITVKEATCRCGCGLINLAPEIVYLFEEVRQKVGCPIYISSASRCITHQIYLTKTNPYATTISPHVEGYALDTKPIDNFSEIISQCAKKLGFPEPRIGYKLYNKKFFHWDLVFLAFQPYTQIPNPRPGIWIPGKRW